MAASETGFIGSQPSMAEYMCSINPLLQETLPEMTPLGAPAAFLDDMGAGMQDVTEYPWMKEKKPQKKAQPGRSRRGSGEGCTVGVVVREGLWMPF